MECLCIYFVCDIGFNVVFFVEFGVVVIVGFCLRFWSFCSIVGFKIVDLGCEFDGIIWRWFL